MKKLLILTGLLVSALPLLAVDPWVQYADTGHSIGGTTNSYSIISANSFNLGQPILNFIDATSDKAGSKVQFYTSLAPLAVALTNDTVNVRVSLTNNITTNCIIVIRHTLTDTYEQCKVSGIQGPTNIIVFNAPATTTIPGDFVYPQATAGSILTVTNSLAAGSMRVQLLGPGITTGPAGRPLLAILDTTTTGQISTMSANFVKGQ